MKKILLFMTAVLMILLWKPIATNAADVEFVHGMYFGSYDELRENVVTGAWGINGTIYHTGIKKPRSNLESKWNI